MGDVKMKQLNYAAMEHAVKNSDCVVAFISGSDEKDDPNAYFNRPLCVQELRWAREVGVPIQPVIAAEDKLRIGFFLEQAPEDLKDLAKTDFIHLDRSRAAYWRAGVSEVITGITDLLSGHVFAGSCPDLRTQHVFAVAAASSASGGVSE